MSHYNILNNEPVGFSVSASTRRLNQTVQDGWAKQNGSLQHGGAQGPQGYVGQQGEPGFQGFADFGLQGLQGSQGPALPRGQQGAQGKSSDLEGVLYENIAVGQTGLSFGSTLQGLSGLYVNMLQGSTFVANTSIPAVYLDSDLLPQADGVYNLGYTGLSFLAAYFSEQSVILGDVSMGVSSSSNECLSLKLTTPLGVTELVNSAPTDNTVSPSLFDIPSFVYGFCKYYTSNEPYSSKTDWTNQVYSMIYLKNPGYDGLGEPLIPSSVVPLDIDTYINALNGSYYVVQFDGGDTSASVDLTLPYMEFPAEGNTFYFQELAYYNTVNYSCGAGDVVFCAMSRSADRTKLVVMMNKVDFFITGRSVGSARLGSASLDNTKLAVNSVSATSFAVGSVGYSKIDPSVWTLYIGLQGAQGATGNTGLQGRQGYIGTQGLRGLQGSVGVAGATGSQGPRGSQGGQGEIGFQGLTGVDGVVSPMGPQGAQGPVGQQGYAGFIGFQGPVSASGSQGYQGRQGLFGRGYMGLPGDDAFAGTQGSQGFASPKNPLGNQGSEGSQGPQGLQGRAGTQGSQGHIGLQGFSSVAYGGSVGPQGHTGFIGVQGLQGIEGSDGWQGPAGFQGVTGGQGPVGAPGFIGQSSDGATAGTQGPQGYKGEAGLSGEQGFQGAGQRGGQGMDGPLGSDGLPGPMGRQGASANNKGWAVSLTSSAWTTYTPKSSAVVNWTSVGINGTAYNDWEWSQGATLTCPATGWYWFCIWMKFNNAYSNEIGISVIVNGVIVRSTRTNGAVGVPYVANPHMMTGCVSLTQNDNVAFSIYSQNSGSNGITDSNPVFMWMYGGS